MSRSCSRRASNQTENRKRIRRRRIQNLLPSVADFPFSICTFQKSAPSAHRFSVFYMRLPKICSLRSQIFRFLCAPSKNLLPSVADFPFSICTFQKSAPIGRRFSVFYMHLPKICSFRSQIFRFLCAPSKNLFASLADFPFSICTLLSLFSLALLAIRSLRSQICSFRSQIFRSAVHFSVFLRYCGLCSVSGDFCDLFSGGNRENDKGEKFRKNLL